MKHIIEEHFPAVVAAIVFIAIIAIVVVLLATDGFVAQAFKDFLSNAFKKAGEAAGLTPTL